MFGKKAAHASHVRVEIVNTALALVKVLVLEELGLYTRLNTLRMAAIYYTLYVWCCPSDWTRRNRFKLNSTRKLLFFGSIITWRIEKKTELLEGNLL